MPKADFRFVFRDYLGAEAETHIYLNIEGGTSDIATAANAIANIISPLSTAFLVRGDFTIETLSNLPPQAALSSDVNRRLLILCRDGINIADFTVPTPSPALPYQSGHSYAGIRITEQSILADPALSSLIALLYRTVDRFGQPFPQGRLVAGLMNNL